MGFFSGEYGGENNNEIFEEIFSLGVLCQFAWAATKTACLPVGIVFENSLIQDFRKLIKLKI